MSFNIRPDFFADNDSSKHGSAIADGLVCLSFQELEVIKDSVLVIVANKQPEVIIVQLRDAGFSYITTKQVLDKLL
jgi:hypothetical protein